MVVACILLNIQFKDPQLCLVAAGLDDVSTRTIDDGLEGGIETALRAALT